MIYVLAAIRRSSSALLAAPISARPYLIEVSDTLSQREEDVEHTKR